MVLGQQLSDDHFTTIEHGEIRRLDVFDFTLAQSVQNTQTTKNVSIREHDYKHILRFRYYITYRKGSRAGIDR